MTTYSTNDLATRALRKANLIGAEETPTAADLEFAQESIVSDTAALIAEGIVMDNGSAESIPIEQLDPRADYHAVAFKKDYGLINEVEAEQARQSQRMRLRRLCARPATGSVLDAEYY